MQTLCDGKVPHRACSVGGRSVGKRPNYEISSVSTPAGERKMKIVPNMIRAPRKTGLVCRFLITTTGGCVVRETLEMEDDSENGWKRLDVALAG